MTTPNEISISSRPGLRVGIDIASVAMVRAALGAFGDRYLRRIYRDDEAAYACAAPALTAERLAARFAAKEATIKAFGWSQAGVAWHDIEVRRGADGAPRLALHGKAAALALASGCNEIAVSLSHEDGQACAIVVAQSLA